MTINPDWKFITSNPIYFFAFGFGTGLSKVAPGTVGTLLGFPLYYVLSTIFTTELVLLSLLILFIAGCYISDVTGKALGVHDHSGIVIDEIVCVAFVCSFFPFELNNIILDFILFRVFDIWKPFPINFFDKKLTNGFGVMFDDLLAAIYSILFIYIGAIIC